MNALNKVKDFFGFSEENTEEFISNPDLKITEHKTEPKQPLIKAFKGSLVNNNEGNKFIPSEIKVEEPTVRQKGIMVSDVAELVQKLKHEAKVI